MDTPMSFIEFVRLIISMRDYQRRYEREPTVDLLRNKRLEEKKVDDVSWETNNLYLCTFKGVITLSHRTGLPEAWLIREAKAGRIPALHVNNRFLFHCDSVEKVLIDRAQASMLSGTEKPRQ